MNKLILASASPRRREILSQVGMKFVAIPSNVEEKTDSAIPHEMVMELSAMKAADVYENLSPEDRRGTVVVGADTVVALGDRVMGKPGSPRQAEEMLGLLQGRTHQVYTGVTLIWGEDRATPLRRSFYEKTDVAMYPMEDEEIRAYVESGEPMDKAGAYGIQGKFAIYIKEISGDYYNVVGLPVGRIYQELKRAGIGGFSCKGA